MSEDKFSIGDAVNFSWDVVKNNFEFLIPAVLILWLVGAIPGGLQSPFYMSRGADAAATNRMKRRNEERDIWMPTRSETK